MIKMLKNDTFLRALRREHTEHTPVWIMRQAGRYLPEYRQTRKKAGDFLTLCKTPELACEVTLQPLARFDLDAAILFSDILTIPDAMGLGLSLNEGVGPKFAKPIRSVEAINTLPNINVHQELEYVFDAVRLIRTELDNRVPLIGFTGSPWTLMTYMVEGGGSKDFKYAKGMLHCEPKASHVLLNKLSEVIFVYLKAQVEAGAQALMIFDTWGGVLSTPQYADFSLASMQQIVNELKSDEITKDVPVTLFTKGGSLWLKKIAATGCDAVGLDWTIPIADARALIGDQVALQGNLDPTVLYAKADTVKQEVKTIIDGFGPHPGHIFNLGHGIHPGIDPAVVKVLVDAVHAYSTGRLLQ